MAIHKCVQFQTNGAKKSKSHRKFREPEGMTNIDLNNSPEKRAIAVNLSEKSHINTFRRHLIKILIITALLIFGFATFLSILHDTELNNLKTLWCRIFDRKFSTINSTDIKNLSVVYANKFENCKQNKQFEECCLIFKDIDSSIVLENCPINNKTNNMTDRFKNVVHQKRNAENIQDFRTTENISNALEYSHTNTFINGSTENNHVALADEKPKQSGINFIVKISKLNRPIINKTNVQITADNTSIIVTSKKIIKRSYAGDIYNIQSDPNIYYNNNQYNNNKQNIVVKPYFKPGLLEPTSEYPLKKEKLENYLDVKTINSGKERKHNYFLNNLLQSSSEIDNKEIVNEHKKRNDNDITFEQPNSHNFNDEANNFSKEKKEVQNENSKNENLRIHIGDNLPNKNKQNQFSITSNNLQTNQHLVDSVFNKQQCIPYTPQVGAPFNVLPPQMPYSYDPTNRFTQLMPISRTPGNSYLINPQYAYPNPNYPSPMSNLYPQYSYNLLYWNHNTQNPPGQYYLCNPVLAATPNQFNSIPGVEVRESPKLEEEYEEMSNKTRSSKRCSIGEISCNNIKKCIKETQICDNQVDCPDANDEFVCSCRDRVGEGRLCDGYFDCPGGEDEIGCFGCDPDRFSCDNWAEDDKEVTCITKDQRCDGIPQCSTGKDEDDCSILTLSFEKPSSLLQVSTSKGFLFRNYQGIWYPTCSSAENWILDICDKETGKNNFPPLTYMVPIETNYKGSYINRLADNKVEIINSCVTGYAVYGECAPPNCGIRNFVRNSHRSEDIDVSMEDAIARFRHKRSNDSNILGLGRVVGGKPSQPAAWPWMVSIYRNGLFHCGGVIVSESWIVTAAHCVDRFIQYYFEVEAGTLRRFSYSPMQQTRFVSHIISHNAYDRANLKNDLAMIKLSTPLIYNRYVRPICLPTELSAGRNYLKEPTPGTLCTAVGWGATVEHGADPDHLREVEVPVLSQCKHKEDEDGHEICAGLFEGGRDACQGDSGGPFMCKNPNSPNQWYLAGIVSHGEGCARPNEPGVYTRVSLYMDWLYEHIHDGFLPNRRPLQKCPGFSCKSSDKCLPKKRHCDRIIDCLFGEDEIHCERNVVDKLFRNAMKHMILLGATRNETKDGTMNKLDTQLTTAATTEATTLITGESTVATGLTDNIFGTTFKMENSPTPNELNRNDFGYTVEDTSFATSPKISDEGQSISYNGTWSSTITAYNTYTKTVKNIPDNHDDNDITTEIIVVPISGSPTEINTSVLIKVEEHFKCVKMLQVIPISKRCDKVADCEDVSDEYNCTCSEYLRNFHPEGVCDGLTECHDLSDERNCALCNKNEYHCKSSNRCISVDKKCDNIPDCPYNEDEWDCFALTDGATVLLDGDLHPHLNTKGVVTFYYRGSWLPMCGENWTETQPAVASDVCASLGFAYYERYSQVQINNGPLKIKIDGRNSSTSDNDDKFLVGGGEICNVLYVKCSNITVKWYKGITNEGLIAPWDAAVYVDGLYKCTGVLLNSNWILTSSNCFRGFLKLYRHYVAVLLGVGGGYLDIVGPHEQIRLVVETVPVLYSDAVLLRLERSAIYTRYVRPLHFTMTNDVYRFKERCYATGRSKYNKLTFLELKRIRNCTSASKCFKRSEHAPNECEKTEKPWSGTIVCESGNGFYPSAIFYEEDGACGFKRTSSFTTLSLLKNTIFDIVENSQISTAYIEECQGFRCELGQCIESRRICDGIPDCRAGEDEDESMCQERNIFCHLTNTCDCAKYQLTCSNGKCVSKSSFCNKINDCEDKSDEPDVCDCFAYLKMSDPGKICDGIQNCYDRSDENPKICGCQNGQYMCAQSHFCIPMEMVCDGHPDCPQSEDEQNCLKLRTLNNNKNAGEVLMRTAGVWHQGCFKEKLPDTELKDMCHQLGFINTNGTYMRFPFAVNDTAKKPILDKFNIVWLNMNENVKFKLAIRSGDKPFVSFVNATDCYRLFLQCQ